LTAANISAALSTATSFAPAGGFSAVGAEISVTSCPAFSAAVARA